MSFHNSAQDIELDGTTLKAVLANVEGEWNEAEINLDEILGNEDGKPSPLHGPFSPLSPPPPLHPPNLPIPIPQHPLTAIQLPEANVTLKQGSFEWGGEGFSGSADDIELSIEGDDNVPILRAKLSNGDGEEVEADINLSERIGNNDGSFHFGELPLVSVGKAAVLTRCRVRDWAEKWEGRG